MERVQRPSSRRVLSAEEEGDLVLRFQAGDSQAGGRLVQACLPFLMTIALEYRRWGVPTEDLVQEGSIGLLKAMAKFDKSRDCRLVTYAAYWIRAEIRDFVVRSYRVVRIGASKNERRAIRHYRKTRERDPQRLAEASGMSLEKVSRLLPMLTAREASLEERTDDGHSQSDRLPVEQSSPEAEVMEHEQHCQLRSALVSALAELPARDRVIVEQRFLCEDPRTLEQIGGELGISKERVRQLEDRAKTRLKHTMIARLDESCLSAA